MPQSRALPIALIAAAVAGCIYTAWNGWEIAFACFCVLGCIGFQELRLTGEFNDRFEGE